MALLSFSSFINEPKDMGGNDTLFEFEIDLEPEAEPEPEVDLETPRLFAEL